MMAAPFGSDDAVAVAGARAVEPSPGNALKDVPTHQYIGIPELHQRIEAQATELEAGHTNQQYIAFRNVTNRDLEQIDRERRSLGIGTRFCYYNETKDLVIKMVTVKHECAHNMLATMLQNRLLLMGLPEFSLIPLGAARFQGIRRNKEGDSTFKPSTRNQDTDWPSIVFECGLSESLAMLRHDAKWWLTDSQDAVKIVVIISVTRRAKTLQVEKWVDATAHRLTTRAHPDPSAPVPTAEAVITITGNASAPTTGAPQPAPPSQYTVTGAPLLLELEKLLLRPPVASESDVIFTEAALESWAAAFWNSFQ